MIMFSPSYSNNVVVVFVSIDTVDAVQSYITHTGTLFLWRLVHHTKIHTAKISAYSKYVWGGGPGRFSVVWLTMWCGGHTEVGR